MIVRTNVIASTVADLIEAARYQAAKPLGCDPDHVEVDEDFIARPHIRTAIGAVVNWEADIDCWR